MGIDALKSAIPDYAKDLRLNLGVLSTSSLEPAAAWGAAYTAALVSKNEIVKAAVLDESVGHLSPEQVEGCKSAAAIMSMNNVWYKFNDLVSDSEIKGQPPKLRMNAMISHAGIGHRVHHLVPPALHNVFSREPNRSGIDRFGLGFIDAESSSRRTLA